MPITQQGRQCIILTETLKMYWYLIVLNYISNAENRMSVPFRAGDKN